jgi:hypothetical protein
LSSPAAEVPPAQSTPVLNDQDARAWFALLLRVARMTFGACPGGCPCFFPGANTVVYRSSHRSVTMRCKTCGIQWTMTWAQLHEAAKRVLEVENENSKARPAYERLVSMTSGPRADETRGRRKRAACRPRTRNLAVAPELPPEAA